jgi:hypothetical protein
MVKIVLNFCVLLVLVVYSSSFAIAEKDWAPFAIGSAHEGGTRSEVAALGNTQPAAALIEVEAAALGRGEAMAAVLGQVEPAATLIEAEAAALDDAVALSRGKAMAATLTGQRRWPPPQSHIFVPRRRWRFVKRSHGVSFFFCKVRF